MKKLIIALPFFLAACGDEEAARIKQLEAQQNQAKVQLEQQQQMAMQQQQLMQQQMVQQPQYAPQAPVVAPQPVIVQQPQHDNTIMNMAVGALAGHAISNAMNSSNNDRPTERVVEHKTVIIDNRPSTPVANSPQYFVQPPVQPKTNYMDMNKLSESAKYTPPSSNSTVASAKPVGGMDMSKLSRPSTPSVPVRPSSAMNMSKLSSRR